MDITINGKCTTVTVRELKRIHATFSLNDFPPLTERRYLIGERPPHYPVPAMRDDAMLHIGYPRVLSEKDRTNADAYFWQMFHRRYGKR